MMVSDFELNKAIAEALGFKIGNIAGTKVGIDDGSATGRYVDYCNNWNDLMPLVVRYLPMLGISRREFIDLLQSENPQRALAECLLKVLESKNAKK